MLTLPRIVGPVPVTATSRPFASVLRTGEYNVRIMKEYDYVEEEYFLFGHANLYGPGAEAAPGSKGSDIERMRPLAGVVKANVPYATRLLTVRPRDNAKFSGRVLAYTFHNLITNMQVEENFLRNGDAVMGVEGNSGSRYGADERARGAMTQLHEYNLERYHDLFLSYADPLVWPDLRPGKLGSAIVGYSVGDDTEAASVFMQEMVRAYAQAPDIMTQLAHALKLGNPALPFGDKVSVVVNYAASGGTTFLARYIDYHHQAAMLPDGRPAFDGYYIAVGILPQSRPDKSKLVYVMSESDTMTNLRLRGEDPPDTDDPAFRVYQVPGCGHFLSAPLPGAAAIPVDRAMPEGVRPFDKINKPILWGIWNSLFEWIERGKPMPSAPRLKIDEAAPDHLARDAHGNALGGLRTPWLDVPDGVYIASVSRQNPLGAGYRPFGEAKMIELYGSRKAYVDRVNARIDEMVRDGWVLPQDADLMKLKA
jgi:Alpha/beta hydrolase domain